MGSKKVVLVPKFRLFIARESEPENFSAQQKGKLSQRCKQLKQLGVNYSVLVSRWGI
jgi:hypothetical protein